MTPRSSDIGYLVYEDLILPITGVELRDGFIVLISTVFSDPGGEITIDQHAECTVVGTDGSQIFWIGRIRTPDLLTARNGEYLTVEQKALFTGAERVP